ncbi:hypothetical protein NDN08_004754 [Rhodosorus marinus]|uniref:Uncharacterized protein n=1 Tax=Rhodosorus marinus TaxID=101924 RepID=A0AAV8URB7_9RHOD|nr:hypothetical protein NDN08_004754 [Rhodosorus marinus]
MPVVVGSSGVDGTENLMPIAVVSSLEHILSNGLIEALEVERRQAIFFLGRADFSYNEKAVRDIVSRGHHVGLSFLQDFEEHDLRYEIEIARSIVTEQGFAESVTGRKPIFLLSPKLGISSTLINATRSIGCFLVHSDSALVEARADILKPNSVSVESLLDSEQIHCAFDRTLCDFVGPRESFRKQCDRFRVEYYGREGIDLSKFVPKRMQDLRPAEFEKALAAESAPDEKSFLKRNRLRTQRAYDKIDEGRSLREIMTVMYGLSDEQIENDLDGALRVETRNPSRLYLDTIMFLAVSSLLLYIGLTVRSLLDSRESILPRVLNSLSGFSKAE